MANDIALQGGMQAGYDGPSPKSKQNGVILIQRRARNFQLQHHPHKSGQPKLLGAVADKRIALTQAHQHAKDVGADVGMALPDMFHDLDEVEGAPQLPQPLSASINRPYGTDSSHWQYVSSWSAFGGTNKDRNIIKIGEGTGYIDPTFPSRWKALGTLQANGATVRRGCYWFFRGNVDGLYQANKMVSTVKAYGLNNSDILVVDAETRDGVTVNTWVSRFSACINRIQSLRPYNVVLIYTGKWFWSSLGWPHPASLTRFGLWLASYDGNTNRPSPLTGWGSNSVWVKQYSDHGSVSGISSVDLDYFYIG